MEYYKNKNIEDLENEIWVDAYGYDGIYEVSNLGRIKSLQREANTRWGTPRIVKEKILTQSIIRPNGSESLIISLDKTYTSIRFIFNSFYPDEKFNKNECVMHINMNLLDNRICNLKKVTRVKSKKTDLIKSKKTIIATKKNIEKARLVNISNYANKTHKECSICGTVDLKENFRIGVSKCRKCMNKRVVDKRNEYVYKNIDKKCNRCGETKKDTDFLKNNGTCRKCTSEKHNIWYHKNKLKI